MTNGTFQVASSSGEILYSGNISAGRLDSNIQVVTLRGQFPQSGSGTLEIRSPCIPEPTNSFTVLIQNSVDESATFVGPVKCDPPVLEDSTAQSSSSSPTTATITSQDSDGDGIPDYSDRCASNSNQRCYKE